MLLVGGLLQLGGERGAVDRGDDQQLGALGDLVLDLVDLGRDVVLGVLQVDLVAAASPAAALMLSPSSIQRSEDLVGIVTPTSAACPAARTRLPAAGRLARRSSELDAAGGQRSTVRSVRASPSSSASRRTAEALLSFSPCAGHRPCGEPVVGLVPAELVGERGGRGVGVDEQQLGAEHRRRSRAGVSASTAVESTVWCGPPAVSQASAEVREVGRGLPDRAGDRQLRQRLVGRRRRRSRWRPAGTGRRGRRCRPRRPGPGAASNTSRTGSSRPPMPSGWISQRGPAGGDASGRPRACARRGSSRSPGTEVVGVVLHERACRRAARRPSP